jgi:hypothetical protein
MTLCVVCAQPTLGDTDVCVFHLYGQGEDWAKGNRIMCDFLHRGIVPATSSEQLDSLEVLVGTLVDELISR